MSMEEMTVLFFYFVPDTTQYVRFVETVRYDMRLFVIYSIDTFVNYNRFRPYKRQPIIVRTRFCFEKELCKKLAMF
jgi:hypothetical protein